MNTLATIVVLMSLIAGMSALTCNTCGWITGVSDESCLDEFDATASNSSVTCASGYDMCSKSTTKVSGTVTILARGCSTSCSEACVSLFSIEGCSYCCSTDDCNSATSVTLSIAAMAATVIGAYVLM
ncbi:synergistic-like venom protein [Asterias rubens]|uniref:synergistic-like venom protein n=1 Tax=Asterias rubens TaxID=7604 RepID=UPI001454EAF8|nr:synergistic-like venom protein [Asterias rubens]